VRVLIEISALGAFDLRFATKSLRMLNRVA
jgi:hypothetical protein